MQNFKETHNQISSITEKIKSISEEKNLMVSTAESCTGGEIAVNLTVYQDHRVFLIHQLLFTLILQK